MTRNLVVALASRARSSHLTALPTRGGGGGPVALNKPAAKEVRGKNDFFFCFALLERIVCAVLESMMCAFFS